MVKIRHPITNIQDIDNLPLDSQKSFSLKTEEVAVVINNVLRLCIDKQGCEFARFSFLNNWQNKFQTLNETPDINVFSLLIKTCIEALKSSKYDSTLKLFSLMCGYRLTLFREKDLVRCTLKELSSS